MTDRSMQSTAAPEPTSRIVAFIVAGLCLVLLSACSSGGPTMSGFALGGTRIVKVGELVELRTPLQPNGTRQWRVSKYDSFYLSVAKAPRIVEGSNGKLEALVTARARTPGETHVEMTEVTPRGVEPRVVKFKVQILE